VVDVVDGRSRRTVERYLRSLPEHERELVEVVSIDPYEAYRQTIQNVLPLARGSRRATTWASAGS
jgi:transposase